jgi:predicted RND superfamily exporter protein
MATRGSQEPLKNMDLYNRLKNTIEQLHSANAQITTLQQHNQKLTKDNETLQQKNVELTKKIKDYEEQVKKQSETIKVMTEEKKKTIEEHNKLQQQLKEEKEVNDHNLKEYWRVVYYELIDGRILKNIKNIINEDKYQDIEENEWINSNKIIELINDISHAIYNNGVGFKYLQEEKITKEQWQKLKEVEKSEK